MIIGGLQKNSLIDYPGKISCVVFLSGCNFDCPYCHNPQLVKSKTFDKKTVQEATVFDFLESHKTFLDGVVISGGEPTIQNDLMELCNKIKSLGYSIKLDTNGSKPNVIEELIQKRVIDYVAMDIKTDPFLYSSYISKSANADDIISSIQLIMKSGIAYEFKTTCIKPFVDETIIEKIAKLIRGAPLFALQQFNHTQVLHPEFFNPQNRLYSQDELMRFKSIAESYVNHCIIR